jgi:hypothetical protein
VRPRSTHRRRPAPDGNLAATRSAGQEAVEILDQLGYADTSGVRSKRDDICCRYGPCAGYSRSSGGWLRPAPLQPRLHGVDQPEEVVVDGSVFEPEVLSVRQGRDVRRQVRLVEAGGAAQ